MQTKLRPKSHSVAILSALALAFALPSHGEESAADTTPAPTRHPALFLVGDSITKTGTGNGEKGPWGMGYELIPLFDPAKILERMQPGDFVLVAFDHNDTANSANYPDRATITGSGDETVQTGVGEKRKTIHTYGWYLRQYVKDAQAKGATIIIGSPFPRNDWRAGKIKRGFDGYAQWAAEAAKAGGAFFIDLNAIASDRYDALGQEASAACFNDFQHTKKSGARINAESVVAGLKQLKDCPLKDDLLVVP